MGAMLSRGAVAGKHAGRPTLPGWGTDELGQCATALEQCFQRLPDRKTDATNENRRAATNHEIEYLDILGDMPTAVRVGMPEQVCHCSRAVF